MQKCVCVLMCVLTFRSSPECASAWTSFAGAKALKDEQTLESIGLGKGGALYFKDLGPQISWSTVRCHKGVLHVLGKYIVSPQKKKNTKFLVTDKIVI